MVAVLLPDVHCERHTTFSDRHAEIRCNHAVEAFQMLDIFIRAIPDFLKFVIMNVEIDGQVPVVLYPPVKAVFEVDSIRSRSAGIPWHHGELVWSVQLCSLDHVLSHYIICGMIHDYHSLKTQKDILFRELEPMSSLVCFHTIRYSLKCQKITSLLFRSSFVYYLDCKCVSVVKFLFASIHIVDFPVKYGVSF